VVFAWYGEDEYGEVEYGEDEYGEDEKSGDCVKNDRTCHKSHSFFD
jgi:hypothetical protein